MKKPPYPPNFPGTASRGLDERKRETRRKILIGAYYLKKAKQDERLDELCREMLTFLTKDVDRCLFEKNSKST